MRPTLHRAAAHTLPLCLGLLLGCGDDPPPKGSANDDSGEGSDGASDGGDGAADGGGDTGACADIPLVNWDTFGAGFLLHHCQGCHASTTPDRYGAPAEVTFDTKEQAWAWRDRILERSAVDPPTMPPAGGTSEDDRVRLRWWLECAPEGT